MKAFIDTSSLFKKYIEEDNSNRFESYLKKVHAIGIAPTTVVEIHKGIKHRLNMKILKTAEAKGLWKEIDEDLGYFEIVDWTVPLWKQAVDLIYRFDLRSMDAIQLASLMHAQADLFLCSDKRLFSIAQKVFKKCVLI